MVHRYQDVLVGAPKYGILGAIWINQVLALLHQGARGNEVPAIIMRQGALGSTDAPRENIVLRVADLFYPLGELLRQSIFSSDKTVPPFGVQHRNDIIGSAKLLGESPRLSDVVAHFGRRIALRCHQCRSEGMLFGVQN
jgi:hypothetical protein